jgi:hypothetical protein
LAEPEHAVYLPVPEWVILTKSQQPEKPKKIDKNQAADAGKGNCSIFKFMIIDRRRQINAENP